jgi:hypothetical protein
MEIIYRILFSPSDSFGRVIVYILNPSHCSSWRYSHTALMSNAAESTPATCKVVLSKNIANGLLAEVQEGVKTLEKPPHLVGFLANSDPAALMYAQWTEKTCQEK